MEVGDLSRKTLGKKRPHNLLSRKSSSGVIDSLLRNDGRIAVGHIEDPPDELVITDSISINNLPKIGRRL
jgi:hypothetical protein